MLLSAHRLRRIHRPRHLQLRIWHVATQEAREGDSEIRVQVRNGCKEDWRFWTVSNIGRHGYLPTNELG
jgi:hypothetical protein